MCVCLLSGREKGVLQGQWGKKRGLQEVSLCPLVTLELVTPYFLLLNYACTPTHPTHNVKHLISLI